MRIWIVSNAKGRKGVKASASVSCKWKSSATQTFMLCLSNWRSETHHFWGVWLLNKGHDKYTARQLSYFPWLLVYILNATLIYFFVCLLIFPLVFHFLVVPSQFSQRGGRKSRALTLQFLLNPRLFLYKALNYFVLKTNKQKSDFQPGGIFNCFLIT